VQCQLCGREAAGSDRLCRYHTEAYRRLKEGFERWCYAYGELDWLSYVRKVAENQETGVWVKDCCRKILKDQEGGDRYWVDSM